MTRIPDDSARLLAQQAAQSTRKLSLQAMGFLSSFRTVPDVSSQSLEAVLGMF